MYLKRNFYQRKKESLTKTANKKLSAEKLRRESFAFFQEKSLRNKIWRDICNWIRAEKSLPKNVWEEILTKSLQEISPAKNLRREISSKESQEQIHEISEKKSLQKQPSRDISKISLKRNFYRTSIWQFFFPEYYTKRISEDFLPSYIPFKQNPPKSSSEIVTAKFLKMDLYSKNPARKNVSTTKPWIQTSTHKFLKKRLYQKNMTRNLYKQKSSGRKFSTQKTWRQISTQKKSEETFLPEKLEKESLLKIIWRENFSQKTMKTNLYTKMLWRETSTKESPKKDFIPTLSQKLWKMCHLNSEEKLSTKKNQESKFHPSFDKTSIDTIKVWSKFRRNFWLIQSKFDQSCDKTLIGSVKVSSKLWFH